jgi:hypothetical protein
VLFATVSICTLPKLSRHLIFLNLILTVSHGLHRCSTLYYRSTQNLHKKKYNENNIVTFSSPTQSTRPACNESDIIIVEALRVLAMAYPKPIPPLDWCFLHEYFHRDLQMRKYCVIIAAKQIVCSGTAKRLIENYLMEFSAADSLVSI